MKIINTFIKLKENSKKYDCNFCGSFLNKTKAIYLLRTSDLDINKSIDLSYTCDNCKERIESKQVDNCDKCGRLKKTLVKQCLCIYMKENNLALEVNSEDSDDEYSPIELEKQ